MPFNRLTASLLVVVIAGVVGLGFLLSELYLSLDEDKPSIEVQAYQALGGRLAKALSGAEDLSQALQQARELTGYQLSAVALDDLSLPEPLLQTLKAGEPLLLQTEGRDSKLALSVYLAIPQSDQLLVLSELPVEELQPFDGTRLLLTLSFYAGLLLVVLLWLAPLVRRLSALRQATRAFGQGELQQRVNSTGVSYIAAIESDFNQMADKIQELMADNRLLSRAVSHDLKTPLARLRFGVEMLSDCDDKALRDKYSQRMEADLSEMESLVTTLLDYARMDDNRPSILLENVDLNVFMANLLQSNESHHRVGFSPAAGDANIQADERYLSMLFLNLLNNANRFASAQIQVSIQSRAEGIVVSVADDGEGIPEAEREQVLKPFVRLSSSSESANKGHGMGLAIVQRLVTWHEAKLRLDACPDLGGARVNVVFNKATLS